MSRPNLFSEITDVYLTVSWLYPDEVKGTTLQTNKCPMQVKFIDLSRYRSHFR